MFSSNLIMNTILKAYDTFQSLYPTIHADMASPFPRHLWEEGTEYLLVDTYAEDTNILESMDGAMIRKATYEGYSTVFGEDEHGERELEYRFRLVLDKRTLIVTIPDNEIDRLVYIYEYVEDFACK